MKIGFVVMLRHLQELGRAPRYPEVRERALQAEAAGFDALWLYDHLLYRIAGQPTVGMWECWTMLSALAEATQRVELGTLVLPTPFRNPALVAKMANTIEEVSNGRFILGVGAGSDDPECTAFGMPVSHRMARFAEALQIIRPLLREGQVDFTCMYYQARDCEMPPVDHAPVVPPCSSGAAAPGCCAWPRSTRICGTSPIAVIRRPSWRRRPDCMPPAPPWDVTRQRWG